MPTLVIFWCVCMETVILLGVGCEDLTLEHGVLHTDWRLGLPIARMETHT